jgi:hypothetical protein
MAHSKIYPVPGTIPDINENRISGLSEHRLRRISIWVMLFFLFQGGVGAVWDREWHAYVGRDQFFTPPHDLIYSCVAGVGLMAFALVVIETIRYRRGRAGVNDSSTVQVFGFFHAPLGFVITGFGALLTLIAAPLDNYWHELYGIDVALWAPFHLMGITGGLIGILGMIYVFASEAALDRQASRPSRQFLGLTALEWGVLLVLGSLMNFTLTGFLQFPVPSFGPLSISTYPLPLVVSATFCFTGAIRFTRRPGVALLIVFFLLLNTLAIELFIPWAIHFRLLCAEWVRQVQSWGLTLGMSGAGIRVDLNWRKRYAQNHSFRRSSAGHSHTICAGNRDRLGKWFCSSQQRDTGCWTVYH